MLNIDDTPRTGGFGFPTPAQQAAKDVAYLEAKEFHTPRVRFLVGGVLAGDLEYCIGLLKGKIELKMTRSDLLEAIGLYDNDDLLGKLFMAHSDSDAKAISFVDARGVLDQYVEKLADLLAKREAAQL